MARRWPLGVSSLGLPGASLDELLGLTRAHGCRAVELRVGDGEPVHLGLDPAARARVRAACADAGLDVPAVATYVKVCGEEPVDEAIADHLRLAADLGAAGIRVFPGGDGSPAAAQRAVARLAAAADLASTLGVRILVETHDSHPRGADVARLLAAPELAGAPVGALWDIAHPWVAGETPRETAQALAPYLSHVQVKDVTERRPGAMPALVGEACSRWPRSPGCWSGPGTPAPSCWSGRSRGTRRSPSSTRRCRPPRPGSTRWADERAAAAGRGSGQRCGSTCWT